MTDAVIERLAQATSEAAEQISTLLPQLTPRQEGITVERLARVLAGPGAVYVARLEGVIVGMIQRVDVSHIVRTKSWIEDFVVDEAVRGQGIASKLLETAIAGAPAEAASINLTSRQARTESHRVYTKFGFELRNDDTVWRLNL
jgi:GNAT superfamily N-acetyltransferase